jgi:hypothetical protein
MVNNLTRDPMFLDSAGAPLSTGRTTNIFKSVEWVGPLVTGDRAYLYDNDNQVVCDFTCDVAKRNQMKYFGDKGQVFEGPFTLSILDSGYLLVSRV